jgi:UDP-3-0-acyl N-acetylglucosamine deacetylase
VSSLQSVILPKRVPLQRPLPTATNRSSEMPAYTLSRSVTCQGKGVHSGAPVTLTLSPAPSGTGILFIRTDLKNAEIKASWETVVDTRFCTTIGNSEGITVSTIEHLMAALAAYGIDDLRVKLDGPELPIMDGSASFFIQLLESGGLKKQWGSRKIIRVLKPITVQEEGRSASLSPASSYKIEVEFDFAGRTALRRQHMVFRPFKDSFAKDIAAARTFGLLEDAQKIWDMGLAKGASLENTLVYEGIQVLNEEGSRYPDECVRHKVLDVMGDLHLAGGPYFGKIPWSSPRSRPSS